MDGGANDIPVPRGATDITKRLTDWPDLHLELATEESVSPPALTLNTVFCSRWAVWVETAAEMKSAPPDYVALALLGGAGAAIGNARWAQPWPGWAEPPVLNIGLIGLPSAGKSPALDAVAGPLSEIEVDDNLDWNERKRQHATDERAAKERRANWEADVKEALKRGNAPPIMSAASEIPESPQRRRIFSTDPTVAKAERMSAGNSRGLLLLRDELAGWVAGMDRFNGGGGSDRAFWLQAYGGRPWTPDRVKDGDNEISVPHLTWGIVGGIQPDRLASLLLAGDDDGLAARFLYTWPAPRRPRRPRDGLVAAPARDRLALLRALPWTPPEPQLVPFTRGAADRLQAFREAGADWEGAASGLFLSWLGKLPGFAIRLSLILAHLDWCATGAGDPPGEISDDHVARSCHFLEHYAVPMARRSFGEAALPEDERDARRLARWLLRQRPMPVRLNAKALRRMADGPGIATAQRMDAALGELAALGWVREAARNREGMGGRSLKDWELSPLLQQCGGAP